ncbi:MAG: Vacuolar protein sorting-associated protein 8 [Peltula sp. TS41687]|nr:MAG: Vacuolar protein sorting-associated protein 8 [Peltula sp. TS41687]
MSSPPESETRGDHALQNPENRLDHSVPREEGDEVRIPGSTGVSTSPQEMRKGANGSPFHEHHESQQSHEAAYDGEDVEDFGDFVAEELPEEVPGSPNESASIPDDTPSVQMSLASSLGPELPGSHTSTSRLSPVPLSRPFDRRFQARLGPSPFLSPRAQSPAFLDSFSRRSSSTSQILRGQSITDPTDSPRDPIRWTKLRKITSQAFSEIGKRNYGRPMCIAVGPFIAVGTSKGIILLFDYNQDLKAAFGPGTAGVLMTILYWSYLFLMVVALECGAILSLALSADHTTIAGGHANGSIFTWETTAPGKPFLHIPPLKIDEVRERKVDGHITDVGVLHLGFLGARRTALVSADGRGMAFSHLATRGLGPLHRTINTTRILGRYPDDPASSGRSRKPSSVLAFSSLPLGNVEHATDTMGLVAMLTPYMLVIVSTTPIAQTQHKAGRPKEVAAHSVLSGCLAWFPSVKLKRFDEINSQSVSKAKLVYCWSDVLTVLDVSEIETSDPSDLDRPPTLSFRPRSRWRAGEPIVAVQWLGRSVLLVLTVTQQLLILEDNILTVTESVDLLNRQIAHHDFFSKHLQPQNDQDGEPDPLMHGVVADAFFASFRVYKGRMFLLGVNETSMGALCNWAQRLSIPTEDGDFIGAIRLAISYFDGEVDRLTIGLPDDDKARHELVQGKLLDVLSGSLKHAFRRSKNRNIEHEENAELQELSSACISACTKLNAFDFLFDDVYEAFEQNSSEAIFLESLEPYILSGQISSAPPSVIKSLIEHYKMRNSDTLLEEMICRMDTTTMDIDQVTTLCKRHNLYDALIYVWNQALGDYITPLVELLSFLVALSNMTVASDEPSSIQSAMDNAEKLFPYLSYTLTGRVYPTGANRAEEDALRAKSELYSFIFAGKTVSWRKVRGKAMLTQQSNQPEPSFPYLHLILSFDAASFLSALNEAFEDTFLNGTPDDSTNGIRANDMVDIQTAGQKINRQYIVSILLEVMSSDDFTSEQTIYLNMFIARNLPKFPQFILLSGTTLHQVLVGLCDYPNEGLAEDCQLSVEYLLSMYHPSDLDTLIALFERARFYRVLKLLYKAEREYGKLLHVYFGDPENQDEVFVCIEDFFRTKGSTKDRQLHDVREVIKSYASSFLSIDITKTAKVVDKHASDSHEVYLEALEEDSQGQYIYLRTILDPPLKGRMEGRRRFGFVEQFVRLMCRYDPSHVVDYIGFLQSGDLRLEHVLPAMEGEGIVDAAVVLMVREGHVRDAMTRLLQHIESLEGALLGLLSGSDNKSEKEQAVDDILLGLQKYMSVGIWICREQNKVKVKSSTSGTQPQRLSSLDKGTLTFEELLWVDLIDSIVRIVKNVAGILQQPRLETPQQSPYEGSKTITSLRSLVQQAFTVLLTSTTSSKPTPTQRTPATPSSVIPQTTTRSNLNPNLSFLRILRAFLTRATLNSPSLADLRSVLTSIFSAYAYESSLLSLSLKLLEKDVFVHVTDATERRSRGWRPSSHTCEGCGRRVWGPGIGTGIWDAWRRKEAGRVHQQQQRRRGGGDGGGDGTAIVPSGKGKGKDHGPAREGGSKMKSITTGNTRISKDASAAGSSGAPSEGSVEQLNPEQNQGQDDAEDGELIVFACGHLFHRSCLEKLSLSGDVEAEGERGREERRGLRCIICR